MPVVGKYGEPSDSSRGQLVHHVVDDEADRSTMCVAGVVVMRA